MLKQIELDKSVGSIEMKVVAEKLGYEQRKFMNVQLGTISENARIGDCYQDRKTPKI